MRVAGDAKSAFFLLAGGWAAATLRSRLQCQALRKIRCINVPGQSIIIPRGSVHRRSSIIEHHLTPAQKSLHDRSNRVPSVPAHREGRDALAVDIVLWSSQLPADKNGIDARSNTINSEITRFYQNITTTQTQHNADNSTTTLNNNDSNRELHSHCGSSSRPVVLRQHAEPIIARREDVVSALVEPNP